MSVITTIQITKELEEKLNKAKKDLRMSKSMIIRKIFKYIDYLYTFMDDYMVSGKTKPPEIIVNKIIHIEEMLNALNG